MGDKNEKEDVESHKQPAQNNTLRGYGKSGEISSDR